MLVKLVQPSNALISIYVNEEGNITFVKLEEFINAFELMVITLYVFDKYVIVEGIIKFHGFGGELENPITETLLLSTKLYITY
jgi:hypothetical protein